MGYKSEQFVKNVDENLICSICHEVFKDPVSCKDGHTFCSDCITEWLKAKEKCPLDNSVMDNKLVRNLTVSGIIDNLDVYCHQPVTPNRGGSTATFDSYPYVTQRNGSTATFDSWPYVTHVTQRNDARDITLAKQLEKEITRSNQTCGWTGKLQDLDKHRKTCPFQQVRCPRENCNKTMQRREMEGHDKTCQFKKVKCEACRKDLIRHEVQKHIEDDCPKTLILCPNNCSSAQSRGWSTKIKRIDLKHHLTNCARAIVDCPLKEQGCLVQVERQHVDKHKQENMDDHVMLLAKQCSSLTKENKLLKDELNKVKENLNDHPLSRYTWKISDYSALSKQHPNNSFFKSPYFWLCGYEWYLRIYPNGDNRAKEFLAVFLYLSDKQLVPLDGEISVCFRIKVLSQTPGKDDVSKQATNVFSKTKNGFGWDKFMNAADALSPAYYNSSNGNLTIQCSIQIVTPK